MKARMWIAAAALAVLGTGCSTLEPAEDMSQAKYGTVVSAQMVEGAKQRLVVRMGDGKTIDVTQDRDSAILQGDIVRVLGSGPNLRVRKL
jgi:outer membrane lipoprotein SlyB